MSGKIPIRMKLLKKRVRATERISWQDLTAWIGISLDFPLLNDLIISLISSAVQSCITMEFLVRLDMKDRNDGSGSTRMPVPWSLSF